MDEATKAEIIELLTGKILELAPDVNLRSMYGGTVIELEKDNPKSRVGGIYAYADYVTLELSKGVSFDDPDKILEGSGKLRRHVKLRSLEDLETKQSDHFLKQAVNSFG